MADKLEPNQKQSLFPKIFYFLLPEKCIWFQGIKVLNSLFIEMRKSSFKNFKDNLKNKLLEIY